MDYDAVIIGGGPAGSRTAGIIAKSGFSTLIIEEHREIGRPVQCSGLVSKEVLEISGTSMKSVIMAVKKARILTPNTPLTIESDDERVFVIDRSIFDKEIARNSIKNGSELLLGTKVKRLSRENRRIRVEAVSEGKKIEIYTKMLIGADGFYSVTARSFGLSRPAEILSGFQAHITESAEEVRVFPEPESTFFSWQIPLKEGSLIGTAGTGRAYEVLKKRFKNFEKSSIAFYAGGIPIGYSKKTVTNNVMIVGDAASQVKPLSGGGLYPGLKSAEISGNVAVKALKNGDFSKKTLMEYQQRWQSTVGKEIKNGLYMRKIYKKLGNEDIEKILSALNNEKSLSIIRNIGDIDHPSSLARSLIKASPKLLVFARYLSGLLI